MSERAERAEKCDEHDDDDISALERMLAEETDDSEEEKEKEETKAKVEKVGKLVESDMFAKVTNAKDTKSPEKNDKSVLHEGDTDSSDDEDKRHCFEKKYDDYGSQIKKLLQEKEAEKASQNEVRKEVTVRSGPSVSGVPKTNSTNVQSDPVLLFGIRIRTPLVSASVLAERMKGRTAIAIDRVKRHVSGGDLSKDWVTAGVVVRKSGSRESQKGSQYCIWTLSDLSGDLKTVSVFLFRNAFKQLWKRSEGTVVGILNPSVLDKSDKSPDEACLSVDNPDRVMVLGESKDFGHCKSRKKNGEKCTAFVNSNICPFCIHHIKQEYGKHSKRTDLQGAADGRGLINLRNKVLGKDTVIYGGKAFSAIPTAKNGKKSAKDEIRMRSLSGLFKRDDEKKPSPALPARRKATSQVEADRGQRLKDLKRLEALGGPSQNIEKPPDDPTPPKLNGFGLKKEAKINLNLTYSDKQKHRAKMNAMKWIQQNGPLDKSDPNRPRVAGAIKKRIQDETEGGENSPPSKKSKTGAFSERFQKMLEAKSSHSELVENHDNNEQEKYFKKLEIKEAMEEKMLNTFKVPCKGVKCLKCDYISFSASEKCKLEKHPLKVFDTHKRFFKCGDCGNRTTCLQPMPMHSCRNCQSSKWQRAAMISEKKVVTVADSLSIRGEEEKFIGSAVLSGANINLLVPDES